MRTDLVSLVSFSPTELLGCLAETLAETLAKAESLFSAGLCANEPLY